MKKEDFWSILIYFAYVCSEHSEKQRERQSERDLPSTSRNNKHMN